MNYSEKLSRTNSSVRFHVLFQSAMQKVTKMFDVKSEPIIPAPELLLRWNTYSTVMFYFHTRKVLRAFFAVEICKNKFREVVPDHRSQRLGKAGKTPTLPELL